MKRQDVQKIVAVFSVFSLVLLQVVPVGVAANSSSNILETQSVPAQPQKNALTQAPTTQTVPVPTTTQATTTANFLANSNPLSTFQAAATTQAATVTAPAVTVTETPAVSATTTAPSTSKTQTQTNARVSTNSQVQTTTVQSIDTNPDSSQVSLSSDYLSQQLAESTQGEPSVFSENGTYYLYYSEYQPGNPNKQNKNIVVYASTDFINWTRQGDIFSIDGVQNSNPLSNIWGPRVSKVGNRYAVIFTASKANEDQTIWIAYGDSPVGPFGTPTLLNEGGPTGTPRSVETPPGEQACGLSCGGDQIMRIDPYYFTDNNGDLWMSYVWYNNGNQISMVKMNPNDPSKVAQGSQPIQLVNSHSTLTDSFGRAMPMDLLPDGQPGGLAIAEGPKIVKHGDAYILFYAANAVNINFYSIYYKKANSLACLAANAQGCSVTQGIAYDGMSGQYTYSHGQFLNINGELYNVMLARDKNDPAGNWKIFVVKQEFDNNGNPVTAMPRPDDKVYIPSTINSWDTNGDGNTDTFDLNGDGKPDAWSNRSDGKINMWDTNGDGKADVYDTTGSGVANWGSAWNTFTTDQVTYMAQHGIRNTVDLNSDGKIDAWSSKLGGPITLWDTNNDGKADKFDTNGDGIPDNFDTNGDGKMDAWSNRSDGKINMWDTNGDGTPDVFDTIGNEIANWGSAWNVFAPAQLAYMAQHGIRNTVDLNGDGKIDVWSSRSDGKINMWDTNGDSKPDVFDTTGSGIANWGSAWNAFTADQVTYMAQHGIRNTVDLNGDGKIDAWSSTPGGLINMWDTNGDGRIDAWSNRADGKINMWDTNSDGKIDAWSNRPDGKVNMWDTNGDGQPDVFDTIGNKISNWGSAWNTFTADQVAYMAQHGIRNTVDLNGDGKIDAWSSTPGGSISMWDLLGTGTPNAYDANGDGKPDVFDKTGGGIVNWGSTWNAFTSTQVAYMAQHGIRNTVDLNGDGKIDAWSSISGGPISMWDTNGDGKADIFNKTGNGIANWGSALNTFTTTQVAYMAQHGIRNTVDLNGDGKIDAWSSTPGGPINRWDTLV